jgi:DNA polymerase IV
VFVSRPPSSPATASIIHADLDAFFASVEQRDDPSLGGRPVIVGIGVVMCASYEARACGVRGAMGGREARQRCPDAVFVEPRMQAYADASRAVFEVFDDTTPLVEGISIDEAFLDVGGLRRIAGSPIDIAHRLRAAVRLRVGLPISVGVARTKFLAKVASAVSKPDGILVVDPDRESSFLHPLPVERMWGIGAKTAQRLHQRGIRTIGDIAVVPEAGLVAMLGPAAGRHVHSLSHHRDPRPVLPARRRRSIGTQRALGRSPKTPEALDIVLVGLVDRVARRLRQCGRLARTVVLRLRFDDFTRATRSHTLDHATADTALTLSVARGLMAGSLARAHRDGVTLVGITLANLETADREQLMLPFATRRHVDAVVDDVRHRYGSTAINRAVLLGRDAGIEMPLLPDPADPSSPVGGT